MEDIHQVFIKYNNFLVYGSSLRDTVPVNTGNTTPNTFSIIYSPNTFPHLPVVSWG